MKSRISAFMDGELDDREVTEPLAALGREGEALEAWRTYHLISDALRDGTLLSERFAARLAERLALEPTVLAPGRLAGAGRRAQWAFLSAAASIAAVALVGWLAFAPRPAEVAPQLVQAPAPMPAVAAAPAPVAAAPAAMVPPPDAANDYLLAHQGYSPRVNLQGMAPYVRTVSEQGAGR